MKDIKMKKQLFFGILVSVSLTLICFGQEVGERHFEQDGGFSYCPPAGWLVREMPGKKYKVAFDRPTKGFAPNIYIVDEAFAGTLDEYVRGNIQSMPGIYEANGVKDYKLLSQAEFITASKKRGARMMIQAEINGRLLRQTFYFFDGKEGRKIILTCSVLADGGEAYDKVFDTSMKTFE